MSESWDAGRAFGELRSLASGRASAERFAKIVGLVEDAEREAPGMYAEQWEPWLGSSLERWAPRHRSVEVESIEDGAEIGARPWARLVRGVNLSEFDLTQGDDASWLEGELRELFPDLEHIGTVDFVMRKPQLEALCESGLFDGMRSLSFKGSALRETTFAMLLERIEQTPEVRVLRFEDCAVGTKQIARLCTSSLLGSLEELALTHHFSKNAKLSEMQLADAAPLMTSLQRLDLSSCKVGWEAAATLGKADWQPALERIILEGNTMGLRGMKGWVEGGRLDLLLDREHRVRLDMGGHAIRPRGVAALMTSDVIGELEEFSLRSCYMLSLEALLGCDALGELYELDISGNEFFTESGVEDVIALLEKTRPTVFDMSSSNPTPGHFEALVASGALEGVRHLRTSSWQYEWGASELECVLDWDGLGGLDEFDIDVRMPLSHGLVARARENEHLDVAEIGGRAWVQWARRYEFY